MKLWIPGSQGLVGTALQNLCKKKGIDFVATSRDKVDIASLHQIKEFLRSPEGRGITHIVNCAAFTHVDEAEKQPSVAHRINALGPENLGVVAHDTGLKLLHLSTDYVFGIDSPHPLTETAPCQPVNTYAKTKHEGELRLLDVYPQACILRTSWVFGPGGKNFVSALWDKIQKEEKISVVNDQKSRITSVRDLAETILSLLCHSGIYHFANSGAVSRFDVAQEMVQLAQKRGVATACREIVPVSHTVFPTPAQRPLNSALNTGKIESLLGTPPRSWQEVVEEFVHEV